MIEIKRVTDQNVIDSICTEYHIQKEPADHVIATLEGSKVLHCAVFSYENEVGKIKAISGFDDDLLLLDGLCRAILNIMDINGVKVVYLSEKFENLAKKVGFNKGDNSYVLELEGFFKCNCSAHNKKGEEI